MYYALRLLRLPLVLLATMGLLRLVLVGIGVVVVACYDTFGGAVVVDDDVAFALVAIDAFLVDDSTCRVTTIVSLLFSRSNLSCTVFAFARADTENRMFTIIMS